MEMSSKTAFQNLLQQINKTKRLSKKMYFHKEFDENKNNCHKMWKTTNSLLYKTSTNASSPPNNIKINGKICDNQLVMAEHFNNFFVQLANVWREKWKITAVKV